jgi:protein-tyrosine phosphatase
LPDHEPHFETVLIVCSANRCRSPLAAALLRRELEGRDVVVMDAGLGDPGMPVTSATLEVAAQNGLDLRRHDSTTVDADMVAQADLVICMERAHVRELVVSYPEAWPKTFTLKEFVRRADEHEPRDPDESLAGWLPELHEGRIRRDLLGASPHDDVADPTTDVSVDHGTFASDLADFCAALVDKAWPIG